VVQKEAELDVVQKEAELDVLQKEAESDQLQGKAELGVLQGEAADANNEDSQRALEESRDRENTGASTNTAALRE